MSRHCGPDDVVTPLPAADEVLRAEVGGRPPQHHLDRVPLREWRRREARLLTKGRWPTRPRFWNHIPAATIRQRVPPAVWDGYLRFAFVRNPWDYVVSRYWWEVKRGHDPGVTLDAVVERYDLTQNWRAITIDGAIAVDRVCRYESLAADLAAVLAELGIDDDGAALPRAKADTGRAGAHYRDVLDDRQAATVAERCADEIAAFGYEF